MAWVGAVSMKFMSENHCFPMLKLVIFYKRFKSQTCHNKFDPLKQSTGWPIKIKPHRNSQREDCVKRRALQQ